MMAGGKKHLGYGCGYVEDIRGAEHRRRKERAQKGDSAGWRSYAQNRTGECVNRAAGDRKNRKYKNGNRSAKQKERKEMVVWVQA